MLFYERVLSYLYYRFLQPFLVSLILVFLPSKALAARILFCILLGALTALQYTQIDQWGPYKPFRNLNAIIAIDILLTYLREVDILLYRRVNITKDGELDSPDPIFIAAKQAREKKGDNETETKKAKASLPRRIWTGMDLVWNNYDLYNPWQIPRYKYLAHTKPPSRKRFLLTNLATFTINYLILDFFSNGVTTDPADFLEYKQYTFSRWSSVTLDEIAKKIATPLVLAIMTPALVNINSEMKSIVTVGLGIYEPRDYPSNWGSVWEIWSVRQLWGKFWHQSFGRVLNAHADFITEYMLGLRKKGVVRRYVKLILCFGISGLLHCSENLYVGVPLREEGSVKFFLMSAFTIMFEDGVQWIYRRLGGKGVWYMRALGAVWTVLFFAWTLPPWTFPISRACEFEVHGFVPWSFIKWMAKI